MAEKSKTTKKTAVAPRPTPTEDSIPPGSEAHTVTEGDTLEGIADQHGVDVRTLQRVNGIKHPALIWPGMTVKLR